MSIRNKPITGWLIVIGLLITAYGDDPGCDTIRPYEVPSADSFFLSAGSNDVSSLEICNISSYAMDCNVRNVVRRAMAMDEVAREPSEAISALFGLSLVSSNIEGANFHDGGHIDDDDSSALCEDIAKLWPSPKLIVDIPPDATFTNAQSLLFGSADDGHSKHSAKEGVTDSVSDDTLAVDMDHLADDSPAVSTMWTPPMLISSIYHHTFNTHLASLHSAADHTAVKLLANHGVTVDIAHGSATTKSTSAMSTMARPPMYCAREVTHKVHSQPDSSYAVDSNVRNVVRGAMAMDEVVREPSEAIPALLGLSLVSSNIEGTHFHDGGHIDDDDPLSLCQNNAKMWPSHKLIVDIAPDAPPPLFTNYDKELDASLLFDSADDGHPKHSAKEGVTDSVSDDTLVVDTDHLTDVADDSMMRTPPMFGAREETLKAQPLSDESYALDPNVCHDEVADVSSDGITALLGLSIVFSLHRTSPRTQMLSFMCWCLFIRLSSAGAEYYDKAYEGAGATITYSGGSLVGGRGYRSLINSSVTNTNDDNGNCISCTGTLSCEYATLDCSAVPGSLTCLGLQSCANTLLYGGKSYGVGAYGFASVMNAVIVSGGRVFCYGERSCVNTNISINGGTTIRGAGAYSLLNATIVTGGDTVIELRGHFAGHGASFTCSEGDACDITCSATGCVGFLVQCLGTCSYYFEDNAVWFITDPSDLIELQMYAQYTPDITDIVAAAEQECDENAAAVTFDDYLESDARPDVESLEQGEGPLCLRAYAVGYGTAITTDDGSVMCSSRDGCSQSTITTQSDVFCDGYRSCTTAAISTMQTLYCLGDSSCYNNGELTASKIYCSGYASCRAASTIESQGDVEVFMLGYYAANSAQLICNAGDLCTVYCIPSAYCVEGVGDATSANAMSVSGDGTVNIIIFDSQTLSVLSSEPTAVPTRLPTTQPSFGPSSSPTRFPTSNPSLYPTTQPSFGPSSSPTRFPTSNPSLYPSKNPSAIPTMVPTEEPSAFPSLDPTRMPSAEPSTSPSANPTAVPSYEPTDDPTRSPSAEPTDAPTRDPTMDPMRDPTVHPTVDPSIYPTEQPSANPTSDPTREPTVNPTSAAPSTDSPSSSPSAEPSDSPSSAPSTTPANAPTRAPTDDADEVFGVHIDIEYTVSGMGEADKRRIGESAEETVPLVEEALKSNYIDEDNGVAYDAFELIIRAINGATRDELSEEDLDLPIMLIGAEIECVSGIGEVIIARSQTAEFAFEVQRALREMFNNTALTFVVVDAEQLAAVANSEEGESANENDSDALPLILIVAMAVLLLLCSVALVMGLVRYRQKAKQWEEDRQIVQQMQMTQTTTGTAGM